MGNGRAEVQVEIGLTPLKALVFQLLEGTSLSSRWFQIPTCIPYTSAGVEDGDQQSGGFGVPGPGG